MNETTIRLPSVVDPCPPTPYNDLLRRILLILQIIEMKTKIVYLLIVLTLLVLSGV